MDSRGCSDITRHRSLQSLPLASEHSDGMTGLMNFPSVARAGSGREDSFAAALACAIAPTENVAEGGRCPVGEVIRQVLYFYNCSAATRGKTTQRNSTKVDLRSFGLNLQFPLSQGSARQPGPG